MKVWLIQIGEPLPLNKNVRKLRTAMLADSLVSRGHEVRWWVSAFDHNLKVKLFRQDRELRLSPGLTLQILRGCGYSSNISLSRYLDHLLIAGKFRSQAAGLESPDVVVASMPCHHLALEAVRYARRRDIPVIVDIRDLWPDIFLTVTRKPLLKKLGRLALSSDFRRLQHLLTEADGLVAVSRGYLEWALGKVGRPAREWDRVFFLGYQPASVRARPLNPPPWLKGHETKKLILFIGTFGFSYELSLVVEAARRLNSSGREDVCFILAGAGEQEEIIRRQSAELPNVLIPGWIEAEEIRGLLRSGYLGLLPYVESAPQSLPNKPFEYLCGGLPLVSSLEGEMAELVNGFGLGLNYRAGDPESLCRALETLLDNPSLRNQMSAHALAFFHDYGDADKIYEEYAEHVESLAEAYKFVIPQNMRIRPERVGQDA
jgi:glycosyltransferase involved in cell wall biosynthesis